MKLVPEGQMIAQSSAAYEQVIAEGPLSDNRRQTEMIRRVGAKISAAVEKYFRERNRMDVLSGFEWEFNLIEKDVPNAWCMPGGKVAFHTGILPFTEGEVGIATAMGHEIAHAVAGHSSERVSHEIVKEGGGYLASVLSKNSAHHRAIMMAYGLGSQVGGILPYSRLHESEADRMGLIFMAMAGYDPAGAIAFWERMSASEGSSPPEFLSTHPSDKTRIRKLRQYMPEALRYYRP